MKRLFAAAAIFVAGSASAGFVGVGDVTDFGGNTFLIASGADLDSGATTAELEGALGLAGGSLEFLESDYDLVDDGDVLNGSALYRDLSLSSDAVISFDVTWSTNEPFFSAIADFAFVSFSGNGLQTEIVFADAFFTPNGASARLSFINPFGVTGDFRVGIGVVDVTPFDEPFASNDSFLDISAFTKTPAPGSLILLALGLIGLGAARRK